MIRRLRPCGRPLRRNMRKRGAGFLTLTLAAAMVTGCIPRGGAIEPANKAPAAASTPKSLLPEEQLVVPEQKIIAETPSWSPAVVERNAVLVETSTYLVQPGDGLYRIESRTGAGVGQIIATNALETPYALKVGQQLTIPGGLYHRVGRGETGIAIARAYGASWADIVDINHLQSPYILRDGQRLRLPDSASAIPVSGDPSPEQRAASFSLNIDDIVTGGEPALASPGTPAPSLTPIVRKAGTFGGQFAWPLNGTLLSRFGSKGGGKVNDGINIAGKLGTDVRAAADGIVVYSGNEIGVFGGLVLIDHGSGWITAYGHLGRLNVARGDTVKSNQAIGTVCETGYVSQPQLHFEIRKDRKPIDPLTKLSAK